MIEDLPYKEGDEVLLLVNGMGSTTMMELSIVYRDLCNYLGTHGISVYSGVAANMDNYSGIIRGFYFFL